MAPVLGVAGLCVVGLQLGGQRNGVYGPHRRRVAAEDGHDRVPDRRDRLERTLAQPCRSSSPALGGRAASPRRRGRAHGPAQPASIHGGATARSGAGLAPPHSRRAVDDRPRPVQGRQRRARARRRRYVAASHVRCAQSGLARHGHTRPVGRRRVRRLPGPHRPSRGQAGRRRCARTDAHHRAGLGPGMQTTASIGIATEYTSASDAGAMLQMADSAMYRAKREGRDRLAVWHPTANAPSREASPVRPRGLEPPRTNQSTRPSTLRVYQFRHRRVRRPV